MVTRGQPLTETAREVRQRLVQMIYEAKGGHIGGSLSSVEILVSLFFHAMRYDPRQPDSQERDRFILSKGHSVEGYYCVLAKAGFFPEEELSSYGKFGSFLYGHPTCKVPGVDVPSGSLGHGLGVACGMALAGKRDGASLRVFVLIGDGELAEGSIWEAVMAAAHFGLDHLVAVVDCNKLQISGPTREIMSTQNLAQRWQSFGWEVREVDGHDLDALNRVFDEVPWQVGRPQVLLAHTIKGRGVSFMENVASWHHGEMSPAQYEAAMRELGRSSQAGSR